jgi:putative flippase GtrA
MLAKFGMVGVLNTLVSFAVFNGLLFLTGEHDGWGAGGITFAAYAAGFTNSFFWNKRWVFQHGQAGDVRSQYVRFVVVSVVVALASSFAVSFLTTYAASDFLSPELWANIAILLTFPLSMLGNFFGYRHFVFKDSPHDPS